jgi:hypothetical protein
LRDIYDPSAAQCGAAAGEAWDITGKEVVCGETFYPEEKKS